MKKSIVLIIVLLLSANVFAKPAPTGGKACEIFNSFYDDSLFGMLAKSKDFASTDAEFASGLAREGFEADQIKYNVTIRNNCRLHVEAMENQYESKSPNQDDTTQKYSDHSGATFINSMSDSDETVVSGEGWKSVSSWRKLKTDMGYDEVREILGEPHRIEGGHLAEWYYPNGGTVTFQGDKAWRWREP